jgi:hypothetical protein
MIYSLFVGIVLGVGHVPLKIAMPVLLCLVISKGLAEIMVRRNFITGSASPYVLYLEKLKKSHTMGSYPWIGYLLQTLLFGFPLGLIAYSFCSYLI